MRWPIRRTDYLLIILSAILLGIAAIQTVQREEGYDVVFRSYQDLQVVGQTPHVSQISFDSRGKVVLRLTDLKDGEHSEQILETVKNGPIRHEIKADNGLPITADIVYLADQQLAVVNNVSPALSINTPYSLDDFVVPISAISEQEKRKVEKLLSKFGVVATDTTKTKIEKIASALHSQLYAMRGVPHPVMRSLNGFQQYQTAISGKSKVYCANHAEIFAYFANVAGVPTRIVDVGGETKGLPQAAHAFAESFVAEQNRWAYVDLQLDIAFLTNTKGQVLNGIDVLFRASQKDWNGLLVHHLDKDQVQLIKATEWNNLTQEFVPPEATLTYLWASLHRFTLTERLYRLLVRPQPAFSLIHGHRGAESRLAATYLGLLFILVVIVRLTWSWARTISGLPLR